MASCPAAEKSLKKSKNQPKMKNENSYNTPLAEVFSLFCSNDDNTPVMKHPFVVGGKTYATDGHTLVRCDNDKVDFDFQNDEKPLYVEGVIPRVNTSEVIDLDTIDWNAIMTTDETVGDGNDVICGHCDGGGDVCDGFRYKGKFYSYDYRCPVCDGSGYEEHEKQIPTGEKTFDNRDVIQFKGTHFYATQFHKLKKVHDLIGGDVELISCARGGKPFMFRIRFLEILIMDCYDLRNVVATIP